MKYTLPVAILAKRGQCSYETKARVAQTLTTPHGAVRFVVVYNDDRRAGQELITMAPRTGNREGTDKIGMVFVSYENGVGEFPWNEGRAFGLVRSSISIRSLL